LKQLLLRPIGGYHHPISVDVSHSGTESAFDGLLTDTVSQRRARSI
jgi:hypothetical protein